MFFELPGRPVKVGETWSATVGFISMDQNFICDSAFRKNVVTVIAIEQKNNDKVVTLKYDIVEFVAGDFSSPFNGNSVKTTMKMTYQAIAAFSVEKGRWLNYNGIMTISSTGMMAVATTKRFALVEE